MRSTCQSFILAGICILVLTACAQQESTPPPSGMPPADTGISTPTVITVGDEEPPQLGGQAPGQEPMADAAANSTGAPDINTSFPPVVNTSVPDETTPADSPSGIASDELAMHNSKDDCWVVYEDKVYDVTSWLSRHPGGISAIARYCGSDAFETAFLNKHGTSKIGKFMDVAELKGEFSPRT